MSGLVRTGIDRLADDRFEAIRGARVGLITNHTGLARDGRPTVDLLDAAEDVDLRALFGPEHGIRGAVDEPVEDGRDPGTGLPVYSLYGARTGPAPEQLAGLDALVYDIQDIGCRFYTYISTLGHCMAAAAGAGVRFVVLDRPNPIGGVVIEGPIADTDSLSFVAHHTLPVRHGMTVGELARLYRAERALDLDLHVVEVDGWDRSDLWDATGLTWTNPSPNIRSLTEALLYPGVGMLEFTNLCVGRGTCTPFELVGAPWIDARRLAAWLNDARVPGLCFVPVLFTPAARIYAGSECGGVNIMIVDRAAVQPVLAGITIASALGTLFSNAWEPAQLNRLLVNRRSFDALLACTAAPVIVAGWAQEIEAFRVRRAEHLLYR